MINSANAAADSGRPIVTRRRVLAAAPLLGLAAGPAFATAEPEDPILPIYREWLAGREEWVAAELAAEREGRSDWLCPIVRAAEDREFAALDEMCVLKPVSMAGVAALAHALWVCGGPTLLEGTPDWEKECETWENRLIASIWRGASGQDGLPRHAETREQDA